MRSILITLGLLVATCGYGQPTADIQIKGVISNSVVDAANKLVELSQTKDTINIVIDSPGGSVYAGWAFINKMVQVRATNKKINCYVDGMAASMAFQILAFCDKRYATSHSMLLWHPVRATVREALTPKDAVTLARDLVYIENRLVSELREVFDVDAKFFFRHYYTETMHIASQLRQFSSFVKILPSLPAVTKDTFVIKPPSFFFGQTGYQYINPKAAQLWRKTN